VRRVESVHGYVFKTLLYTINFIVIVDDKYAVSGITDTQLLFAYTPHAEDNYNELALRGEVHVQKSSGFISPITCEEYVAAMEELGRVEGFAPLNIIREIYGLANAEFTVTNVK
jgi:hypothetical protein